MVEPLAVGYVLEPGVECVITSKFYLENNKFTDILIGMEGGDFVFTIYLPDEFSVSIGGVIQA